MGKEARRQALLFGDCASQEAPGRATERATGPFLRDDRCEIVYFSGKSCRRLVKSNTTCVELSPDIRTSPSSCEKTSAAIAFSAGMTRFLASVVAASECGTDHGVRQFEGAFVNQPLPIGKLDDRVCVLRIESQHGGTEMTGELLAHRRDVAVLPRTEEHGACHPGRGRDRHDGDGLSPKLELAKIDRERGEFCARSRALARWHRTCWDRQVRMARQPSADYRLPLAIEPRAESLDSMTTRSYQSPPDWCAGR